MAKQKQKTLQFVSTRNAEIAFTNFQESGIGGSWKVNSVEYF